MVSPFAGLSRSLQIQRWSLSRRSSCGRNEGRHSDASVVSWSRSDIRPDALYFQFSDLILGACFMILNIRKIFLLGAALCLALLVGCSSISQDQSADDDAAPAATGPAESAPRPGQSAPQADEAEVGPAPVSFFLAQEEQDGDLIELKLADGSLWASPDAILTRADLNSVEPRRTQDGQAFVRFGFSQAGSAKLAEIAGQHSGKLLLVAVGNDVVGLTRIGMSDDGVLDVAMESDQQAIAVADAVAGVQSQQPSAAE